MPRISRFTISAIDALVRDLAYAPSLRRIAQIDAAEAFVREIDVNQIYPHDFVVWRLTGYRPDLDTSPAMHLGAALITDLVNFIQAISSELDLPVDHANRHALTIDQAAAKMNVTDRTIRRYRKYGLVCHYICFPNGKRLGVFVDALDDFCAERTEGTRLSLASSFSRVSIDEMESMISEAQQFLSNHELSTSEVIGCLQKKYSRSRETIRSILINASTKEGEPLLEQRMPLSEAARRDIIAAWRRGASHRSLGKKYERSAPAIHRIINSMRRTDLLDIDLNWVELPAFQRQDASQTILQTTCVCHQLNQLPETEDALELIDLARAGEDSLDDEVMSMITAINWLKRGVCKSLEVLPAAVSSAALDQLETELRWVALLERRLTWLALPTAIRCIEQFLGQPVIAQPGVRVISILKLAIGIIAGLVHEIDSGRDQRLSRMVTQAIDRSLARGDLATVPGRAAVRHQPGSLVVPGVLTGLTPASRLVEPDAFITKQVMQLDTDDHSLMQSRWGLDGLPPKTIAELAHQRGITSQYLASHMQRLISSLWAQR